jgi:hypothetical protein
MFVCFLIKLVAVSIAVAAMFIFFEHIDAQFRRTNSAKHNNQPQDYMRLLSYIIHSDYVKTSVHGKEKQLVYIKTILTRTETNEDWCESD